MNDLIERLRALSRHEHSDYSIGDEAADVLEAAQAERKVIVAEAMKYAGKSGRLEAKVERLEEALDTIARVGKASRNQTTRTRWIVARAISALNSDNDWQALPKPKGFHDALLHDHDQEVGNG